MRSAISALLVCALASIGAVGQNQSTSKTITIQVVPGLSFAPPSPVPAGVVGQAYTLKFTASGGVTPFVWTGTGLPSWLAITTASDNSGVLAGTIPNSACTAPVAPATTCPFSFSVTVTDSTGTVARLNLQGEVEQAGLDPAELPILGRPLTLLQG